MGQLPPLRNNGKLKLQPTTVLQIRWRSQGQKRVAYLLVQWEGLHIEDATWERYDQLAASLPKFVLNLEDKVRLQGEGIDGVVTSKEEVVERRKSARGRKPNPKYND